MTKNQALSLLLLSFSLIFLHFLPLEAGPTAEAPVSAAHVASGASTGHTAAEEENLFAINPLILLAQTVNFFLLLWLLNKLLYTPLQKVIDERRAHIATDLDLARQSRLSAEDYRTEWQKKMETVEQESYRLRQQAIGEANAAREQILAEAKASAASQKQAADKDILLQKQKAWVELREEVVQLSLAVAEKVIEQSLDDKAHHVLIRNAIAQLEKPQ